MDYKYNRRFFSPNTPKRILILTLIGALICILSVIAYFIFLDLPAAVTDITMILGISMIIAAFAAKPKVKYLLEQIETQKARFVEESARELQLPDVWEDTGLTVGGFLPWETAKPPKSRKPIGDRVEFSLLYRSGRTLTVRTLRQSLTEESSEVHTLRFPIDGLSLSLSESQDRLILESDSERAELVISDPNYQLEEFIDCVRHQQK